MAGSLLKHCIFTINATMKLIRFTYQNLSTNIVDLTLFYSASG